MIPLLLLMFHMSCIHGLAMNPQLLSRQIRACRGNVDQALELLGQHANPNSNPNSIDNDDDQGPFLEALQLCGKAKRPDLAMKIYQTCPTPQCQALTISICGHHGQLELDQALEWLWEERFPSEAASYNAAIAACAKAAKWEQASQVLDDMPPIMVSTLTCHAVLTALSKQKRGDQAVLLLRRMQSSTTNNNHGWIDVVPNKSTYHIVVQALVRQGDLRSAQLLLEECRKVMEPSSVTIDILVAALGKVGQWDTVRDVQGSQLISSVDYFRPWETLAKVGKGKFAYWRLGDYRMVEDDGAIVNVTVALQPNRNPRKNGMRLILVDSKDNTKLGFLLMMNNQEEGDDPQQATSSLLGLRVEENLRGRGLAKVFLALWMQCCIDAGIRPVTGVIHKPLLALVLQHTFQFQPSGGVVCTACPSGETTNTIRLFSNGARSLEGVFSPWDLQTQRVVLSDTPLKGREIRVGATWVAPEPPVMSAKVEQALSNGQLFYDNATIMDLRSILLGA
jgi:pentatricopeptide repeat protein